MRFFSRFLCSIFGHKLHKIDTVRKLCLRCEMFFIAYNPLRISSAYVDRGYKKPVDNTSWARKEKGLYPSRGEVKLSM